MKQAFFKFRKQVMILALSGIMISAYTPSFANNKQSETILANSVQPTVNYVGSDASSSVFLVKVDAASPAKFEVSIKNSLGIVFYSQVFEAATFAKTFRIENADRANLNLSFTIKTLADNQQQTFNVASEEKMVTDVVVKKA